MRLALLITNTDKSAFAAAHDGDDVKFAKMISAVRPEWQVVPFWVCDGEFPDGMDSIDGVMITGSPASVRDDAAWIARLFELIRQIVARNIPLFGACFGHQAIALALGGQVARNPNGWQHGVVEVAQDALPWADPMSLPLYASHCEQVTVLPPGAAVVAEGPDCTAAGFVIGQQVYTTQYHPEMEHGFIAALTEELTGYLPEDVLKRAKASLTTRARNAVFAEQLARFFEQGVAAREPEKS